MHMLCTGDWTYCYTLMHMVCTGDWTYCNTLMHTVCTGDWTYRSTLMHMLCTTCARIYYHFIANLVHSRPLKKDKTKILMTNDSLMKVESIAECSHWSIMQFFWPALAIIGLENKYWIFLRVAVLHRFYCLLPHRVGCNRERTVLH